MWINLFMNESWLTVCCCSMNSWSVRGRVGPSSLSASLLVFPQYFLINSKQTYAYLTLQNNHHLRKAKTAYKGASVEVVIAPECLLDPVKVIKDRTSGWRAGTWHHKDNRCIMSSIHKSSAWDIYRIDRKCDVWCMQIQTVPDQSY